MPARLAVLGLTALLLTVAVDVVVVPRAHADSPAGVQIGPNGKWVMINKDVNGQRWAITLNTEDQTASGNVFLPDGSDPQFVWCETTQQVGDTRDLSCWGAPRCLPGPCPASDWASLGSTTLPESFFHPPGTTLPAEAVGASAGGAAPAAAGHSTSGARVTRDGKRRLISKDVNGERWAISYDFADRSATGNVFQTGGGPPLFVWCRFTGENAQANANESELTFECSGADRCASAPCDPAQWTPLGTVRLPGAFFADAICGDGASQPGEECDDGNGEDNDGCSNTCLAPVCGDGVCGGGETCSGCARDCGPCTGTCPNISDSWRYEESGTVRCTGAASGTYPGGGTGSATIDQQGCDIQIHVSAQGVEFSMTGRIENDYARVSGELYIGGIDLPNVPFDVNRWTWEGPVSPDGFTLSGDGEISVSAGGVSLTCTSTSTHEFSKSAGSGVERFAGSYSGTYSGDDEGEFEVDIDSNGVIEGYGYSYFEESDFEIYGAVEADGRFQLVADGEATNGAFNGTIGSSGRISGSWNSAGASGSFSGQKESAGASASCGMIDSRGKGGVCTARE